MLESLPIDITTCDKPRLAEMDITTFDFSVRSLDARIPTSDFWNFSYYVKHGLKIAHSTSINDKSELDYFQFTFSLIFSSQENGLQAKRPDSIVSRQSIMKQKDKRTKDHLREICIAI